METLTETPFFKMLSIENSYSVDNKNLADTYKEFTLSVLNMSKKDLNETPAFFTLNYTLVELTQLLKKHDLKGSKKKCAHSFLH